MNNYVFLVDAMDCLAAAGDATNVTAISPLGGGCIHQVYRIATAKRSYLLKWNPRPLEGVFEVEARGLALLAATGTVHVPQVIATHRRPDFILLEWIQSDGDNANWNPEMLGRQLAALHRFPVSSKYGLDHDNYIGANAQRNAWHDSWIDFYRDYRLRPQIQMASLNHALPDSANKKLDWILEHLDHWIDEGHVRPSLLHGDLWAGNVIAGPGQQPVMIDPAVYYGDREADLAFTELFGGFSKRFYQAYQEAWPLEPGYPDRRDFYNLYHLLNHLNLFGPVYASQVISVINHYAGN